MSRDNAEDNRQRDLQPIRNRSAKDSDDIQDFAEHTMNELLAWYGYGDHVTRDNGRRRRHHHHHHSVAQSRRHDDDTRHRMRPSDVTDLVPDFARPDVVAATGSESPPSLAAGPQHRVKERVKRETAAMETKQLRPDSVSSVTSNDSVESRVTATTNVKSRSLESDYLLDQQRADNATTTTTTTMTKLCDWCRQMSPDASFVDSVEGLSQLSFCGEFCLNRYKMNLFCSETRQYLQQLQSSEDSSGGEITVTASDSRILITPDLWMVDRTRPRPATTTVDPEDGPEVVDRRHSVEAQRHDDDLFHHSDTASNLDASNDGGGGGVLESGELLESRRKKRKKEEVKGQTMTSPGGDHCVAMATKTAGDEGSDFESEKTRKGKRLKSEVQSLRSVFQRSVSALDHPEVIPPPPSSSSSSVRDLMSFASGGGGVGGKRGAFEDTMFSKSQPSDFTGDLTQFRRLIDGVHKGERSKCENPLGSWQGTSTDHPFNNPFPAGPLFSLPDLPSVLHNLLGPTLGSQFLGSGGNPCPFLGIPPPLLSMPGAGGGTAPPPPPPHPPPSSTSPWSSLLPPNTLMVPYPVLLPLPIPIPIPFPLPAKEKKRATEEEEEEEEERSSESKMISNPSKKAPVDSTPTLLPGPPPPPPPVVCGCCLRRDSLPSSSSVDRPVALPLNGPLFPGPIETATGKSSPAYDDSVLDFSMSKDPLRQRPTDLSPASLLRTPPPPTPHPPPPPQPALRTVASPVTIKSEPIGHPDTSSVETNQPTVAAAAAAARQGAFPCLPYLARRSLILDAPSVLKEKPQQPSPQGGDRGPAFAEASAAAAASKRFVQCKRQQRCANIHVKTK